MPLISIDRVDDSRLQTYCDIQKRSRIGGGEEFVVEGTWLVERLIRSGHRVESVLIQEGRDLSLLSGLPEEVPVYQLSRESIKTLLGFDFHRGVLASGRRPDLATVDDLINDSLPKSASQLILAALEISDKENLGSMLRSAAAFGVSKILTDPGTVDPYSRRVLRVSMGTGLIHRFYQTTSPLEDLPRLQASGFQLVAATLDENAVTVNAWRAARKFKEKVPTILMMGNEARGLPEEWQQLADHRVRIAMRQSTDSLNVAVAAAILMHEMRGE